jgi:hypothetical protein
LIVWLASWPRSGNTLLRIRLHQAFGLETWSVYDDSTDIGSDMETARIVGHRAHGLARDEFVKLATALPDTFFVKTHELPSDGSPAIYVVRDGRSAVVSWRHYCQSFKNGDPSLEDVIRGTEWPGSWSEHVRAWALSGRPETLGIRYEDLVARDSQTLEAIASFIGREFRTTPDIPFDELHAVFPRFFRAGSNEKNVAELSPQLEDLFTELHGDVLAAMGYSGEAKSDWPGWKVGTPGVTPRPSPVTPEARLAVAESSHEAYLAFILKQGAELSRLRAGESDRDALAAALAFAEADREARLAVIQKQGAELGRLPALEADRDALAAGLAFAEADREARLAVIHQQGAELEALRSALENVRGVSESIRFRTLLGVAPPSEVRRLREKLAAIAALARPPNRD